MDPTKLLNSNPVAEFSLVHLSAVKLMCLITFWYYSFTTELSHLALLTLLAFSFYLAQMPLFTLFTLITT